MSTPHYDMFKPTDDDSMSDVTTSLNNSFDIIKAIPRQTIVTTIPATDFSYSVGDRIYHSGVKSTFILVAQDPNWGNIWKPVQNKYSPWVSFNNSILTNTTIYSLVNLQYRTSNTGKFIMRGGVQSTADFADFGATGTSLTILDPLPDKIKPFKSLVFRLAVFPQNSAVAVPMQCRLGITGTTIFQQIWNPLHGSFISFDGVEWILGSGGGYGTDL